MPVFSLIDKSTDGHVSSGLFHYQETYISIVVNLLGIVTIGLILVD